MAATSAHELYRRWLAELWNGNPSAAHDLVAPHFVGHWPDRDVRGPDELAAIIGQTQEMFSDLSFTLEVGPIVEGDLVAGRWTGRGHTPDGELSFFGNDLLRVENGRFVEYWTASSAGS
ncbi:MAG: ester cyclase [Pseudonocardia sp.]|nr:ester cyclase [Pseudonocardia sp.]